MYSKSEEEFNIELGHRLMRLRQSHKMTQESLGVRLGVRYQQIQKYELGHSRIPPEKLAICAKLFETCVDYLFYGDKKDGSSGHSKSVLMVAEEISKLPSIELRRTVYQVVKEINHYVESNDSAEENIMMSA